MAYREIEQWRQILESEDAEKRAYDEACERRAEEKAELDEKEFWDCDQAEVDPKTMGLDKGFDEVEELANVEDVDEEIDFSGYGISEADMREPLQKVSSELGMPASTASLTGQDSVSLAEAIMELTKALKTKRLDEASVPTDAGWMKWAGGEDVVKGWDDVTKKKSRELFDDLVKRGKIDGATGFTTPEVELADIKKMQADYKKVTGYEHPDADGEEQYAAAEERDAESKEALAAAKRFYDKWFDDPDFREKNALKDKDGATVMKPAGYYKLVNGRHQTASADDPEAKPGAGKVIAGTDPNSQGAQLFRSYFDKMTPEDQEAFDAYARQRQSKFTTKHYAPHKIDSLNKKGSLHGTGDDDENVNPLAQHGLDQTFNADNADDDMFDDPENGDEFYSQFDPNHVTISHEQIAKDVKQITDIATAWAKKKGMSLDELTSYLKDERKFEQIVNTILDNQKKKKDVQDYQLEFMFKALDQDQLDELRHDLEAEADTNAGGNSRLEKRFIDYLFRFGKNRKLTQEDFNFIYGIGGDQEGGTGNGTQYDDRHLGMLVAALGRYFEIDEEETSELLRVCYSQNRTKKDKALNIEPRRYARHLLCKILQELYDGFKQPGMPAVTVPQSPAIGPDDGPKIQGKDWDDVKKKVAGFCWLLKLKMKKAELRQVAQEIENVFEEKYGTFDQNGNMLTTGSAKVRKMVTRLSRQQNDEFQQLVDDARNGKPMSDDAKLRLLQLDYMRFGKTNEQARAMAEKDRDGAMKAGGQKKFDELVVSVVKAFLSGGSKNVTKDEVKLAEAARARRGRRL